MSIVLKITEPGGKTRLRTAKQGVTLEQVREAAEHYFSTGKAIYAAVIVDGKIETELEA